MMDFNGRGDRRDLPRDGNDEKVARLVDESLGEFALWTCKAGF